jgi:ABC-type multidrug transport system permease subunit
MFYFSIMMVGQVAAGMGFVLSAASESAETATSSAGLFTLPTLLFAGLFANTSTVFGWLSWLQWLSCVRYGFQGTLIAEFRNTDPEWY